MEAKRYSFAVLGASGNVGRRVVKELAINPRVGRVVLLNRRDVVDLKALDKVESIIVDMDNIEQEAQKHLESIDDLL